MAASQAQPLHPYNIMLYRISAFLKEDMDNVFALGRIMGCRELQNVNNPWMLFEILETKGHLSEFKVVDLRKALELIGLSEAGQVVKEYEDTKLKGRSEAGTPSPNPPPYSFIQDNDDTQVLVQENGSSEDNECTKPLSSHDDGPPSKDDIPTTSTDTKTSQETRQRVKSKYHTISAPSMEKFRERNIKLNGMEQEK